MWDDSVTSAPSLAGWSFSPVSYSVVLGRTPSLSSKAWRRYASRASVEGFVFQTTQVMATSIGELPTVTALTTVLVEVLMTLTLLESALVT
jgi:hypothetical protein